MPVDPARAYVRAQLYRAQRPDPDPEPTPIVVEDHACPALLPAHGEAPDSLGCRGRPRRPGVLARLLSLFQRPKVTQDA
ncbi:hypothetical protein AB0K09_16700 [Streptomyces sp. NPDC049577]|uniref:hypothetical protein n=1 Tax=Streptomyces sp. NPDC049577 TaxID=3155153 RepID=UPI003447D9AC